MAGVSVLLAFALAAVGTSGVAADVFPRQTTFSNTTTSSTSPASGIPTPPPCCWILAGTQAVGLNKWYTSTAEHVVATVITTYIRENNGSAVPANSTTIYANTTGYPAPGDYGPFGTHPWVTIPGVPYTLLPEGFNGVDYARTSIDNATALNFPGTDLVIQQPMPYNEWFRLAVFTAIPDTSAHSSSTDLTAWPLSMCGTYKTEYGYETVTQTITSGGTVTTTLSIMSSPTGSQLIPSGKDSYFFHTAALIGGAKGVNKLNVTYIEPKTTQGDKPRAVLKFPTGLVGWLGEQENVVAQYPYITDCWTDEGWSEGQPTVHVPVNALTVTSSHIIDVQKAPSPTTSPSAVKPTESVRTEIEESSLDLPPSPSPTTSPSAVKPTESARTEIEGSSLDLPPPPPSPSEITRTTQETTLNIPGMTAHTEIEHISVDGPETTSSRMPKAHVEESALVLDVPTRSRTSANTPGSALPARTSDAAAGEESSSSRPDGVIIDAGDDDGDDGDDDNGNGSEQEPSRGSSSGDNNNEQDNGIGGLISAIQSVASQQTGGASSGSQENNQHHDVPARPAAAVTDNDSGPRASPAPSITGFVVGSRTLTPGGAAITQSGSTFSALPSGSGLQIIAQSETLRLDGVVPPGMFAVSGVVQRPDSKDEYLVGNNAVSAGGSAVAIGRETFSALPSGSGVQVVNGDGQTRTEGVVAVASIDSSPVRSGKDDDHYVIGSNTLSVGGQALTIDGTTFSALPSLSGIAVGSEGQTSTASLGVTVDFLTVTGASVSAFATPVLLPGNDDDGDDSGELVTLGGSTYTALTTSGSLLVIDGYTVKPGETTVINGETVVLSGTSLVIAKATATSTHGLGDAILSGIGGGPSSSSSLSGEDEDESTPSSSGSDSEETGASGNGGDGSIADQSGAIPRVQAAFGCLVASAVFALALM